MSGCFPVEQPIFALLWTENVWHGEFLFLKNLWERQKSMKTEVIYILNHGPCSVLNIVWICSWLFWFYIALAKIRDQFFAALSNHFKAALLSVRYWGPFPSVLFARVVELSLEVWVKCWQVLSFLSPCSSFSHVSQKKPPQPKNTFHKGEKKTPAQPLSLPNAQNL